MPIYVHIGDGAKTTFKCPSVSNADKYPRVNGVYAHFVDASSEHITLDVPPANGAIVEIIAFTDATPDYKSAPPTLEAGVIHPITPVILFHGAGAEVTEFVVDPKAKRMDVWAHKVDTSY